MTLERLIETRLPVGAKVIFITQSGSSVHGTTTPSSDVDYKALFVPSLTDLVNQTFKPIISISTGDKESKNTKDDIDVELISVFAFLKNLNRGEVNAIEVLFSMFSPNTIEFETKSSLILKDNYKNLITNNLFAFVGFANKQAERNSTKGARVSELVKLIEFIEGFNLGSKAKLDEILVDYNSFIEDKDHLGILTKDEGTYLVVLGKLHNAKNTGKHTLKLLREALFLYGHRAKNIAQKDEIDYKGLSHSVRVVLEAVELLETGFIKFPLERADLLRDIKMEKLTLDEVLEIREDAHESLIKASETSNLPTRIDMDFLNNLHFTIVKSALDF